MAAAPPGTVTMDLGDGVTATISYNASTGVFNNPAIVITNNGTVAASLSAVNPNNGQTVTITVKPGGSQNIRPTTLSNAGINVIGDLWASLGE